MLQVIRGNIYLVKLVLFVRRWLFTFVLKVWSFILNWELVFKAFFVDDDIVNGLHNHRIFGTLRCLILHYIDLTHLVIGRENLLLSLLKIRLLLLLPVDQAKRNLARLEL